MLNDSWKSQEVAPPLSEHAHRHLWREILTRRSKLYPYGKDLAGQKTAMVHVRETSQRVNNTHHLSTSMTPQHYLETPGV